MSTSSLVLNATYEPLCVVSSRRAVVLVLSDKAEIIHESGDCMHSERITIAVPTVVRLTTYVRVPVRRRAPLNRRAVFARDGGRCQYCTGPAESIDHVVPRSRGGEHVWENVVAACRACNTRKRDRLLSETRMELRRRPVVPRELTWITIAAGTVPMSWEPYLTPALTA